MYDHKKEKTGLIYFRERGARSMIKRKEELRAGPKNRKKYI